MAPGGDGTYRGKGHSLSSAFNRAAGARPDAQMQTRFYNFAAANDAVMVTDILARAPQAAQWLYDGGMTALMKAAEQGAGSSAAALLKSPHIQVDATNENGSTALMYAAYSGKATVADLLVKAGAHVNHANHKGHTALMSAAAYGHKNTIGVLIAAGADPRMKSDDGASAIDFARNNGHPEIAKALEKMAAELDAFEEAARKGAEQAAAPTEAEKEESYRKTGSAIKDLQGRMAKANLLG